jgi:hypothetical protein
MYNTAQIRPAGWQPPETIQSNLGIHDRNTNKRRRTEVPSQYETVVNQNENKLKKHKHTKAGRHARQTQTYRRPKQDEEDDDLNGFIDESDQNDISEGDERKTPSASQASSQRTPGNPFNKDISPLTQDPNLQSGDTYKSSKSPQQTDERMKGTRNQERSRVEIKGQEAETRKQSQQSERQRRRNEGKDESDDEEKGKYETSNAARHKLQGIMS